MSTLAALATRATSAWIEGVWQESNLTAKRVLDVVLALTCLALTLPFLFLVPMVVKLTSSGPVLYRQVRIGKGGRRFTMFKFRTMAVDAELGDHVRWASANDPRVTHVGVLLRRYHIDELPQLLNVLQGDMSFVGPRPEHRRFHRRAIVMHTEEDQRTLVTNIENLGTLMDHPDFACASTPIQKPWIIQAIVGDLHTRRIIIKVEHPRKTHFPCPECHRPYRVRDHAKPRLWRHSTSNGIESYLMARAPRIHCPRHGVRQVLVPWANPWSRMTKEFEEFVKALFTHGHVSIRWVARLPGLSWDQARASIKSCNA